MRVKEHENLAPIVFHELNTAMHNHTHNLNEIRVFHPRCKSFICSAIFLSEVANCCLLLLIKVAPLDLMLFDRLQLLSCLCMGTDPVDLTWMWASFRSTLPLQPIFFPQHKILLCTLHVGCTPLFQCWYIQNKPIYSCNQQERKIIPSSIKCTFLFIPFSFLHLTYAASLDAILFLHWRETEDLLPLSRSSSFFFQTFNG